jgi:protein TonB
VLNSTAKPDVLTIALFAAAAAHAVFILGVTFDPDLNETRTPPPLEVLLVQNSDSERPDEADYLADRSQDGGGENETNTRPSAPFTSDQDLDTDGIAQTAMIESAPEQSEASEDTVLTTLYSNQEVNTENEVESPDQETDLNADVEVDYTLEIARLQAEIDRQQEQTAKRPRKKFLTARTHESSSATYMHAWVEKVERIGNLNYPDAVRRNRLSGAVVMTVGIFKNGAIESIAIDESSGEQLLDDAAKRIVRLASPFNPLSGTLREETDILYITRTWDFQNSNSVTSY